MRARDSFFGIDKFTSRVPEIMGYSLSIYQRMYRSRYFEQKVAEFFDAGVIGCPVYLSAGQESVAAALSLSFLNPIIFAQHRAHDLYLSYGGNVIKLIDELLHLPSGCAGGIGGSASIHEPDINMIGHDGLMGTQAPIGVGYAMATGKKTLVVVGDASGEEDYVLSAYGFAATHKVPLLFVCIDNGVAVLTEVEERRNWELVKHANFGMPAIDIADDPWAVIYEVKRLEKTLPAMINIRTCRISSHAGTRKDSLKEPKWNRLKLVRDEISGFFPENHLASIEKSIESDINYKWSSRLEVANASRKR